MTMVILRAALKLLTVLDSERVRSRCEAVGQNYSTVHPLEIPAT